MLELVLELVLESVLELQLHRSLRRPCLTTSFICIVRDEPSRAVTTCAMRHGRCPLPLSWIKRVSEPLKHEACKSCLVCIHHHHRLGKSSLLYV